MSKISCFASLSTQNLIAVCERKILKKRKKMNEKKSLLEKYSIPVEHLDFEYIKTCRNVRELEKMIEILRSGEEGYYPDLTKFAEEKLREIDPENRMLRTEVKCFATGMNERQEINVRTEQTKFL